MRAPAPILFAVVALALSASACATRGGDTPDGDAPRRDAPRTGLFGGGPPEPPNGAIGVNAFLWRATLDTLSFMPIQTADPFGGTVVTDWHATAERPNERFKVQVYILDTRLRADGISVAVFRQVQGVGGGWIDATVDPDTPLQIENAILTRARQLRIATLEGGR